MSKEMDEWADSILNPQWQSAYFRYVNGSLVEYDAKAESTSPDEIRVGDRFRRVNDGSTWVVHRPEMRWFRLLTTSGHTQGSLLVGADDLLDRGQFERLPREEAKPVEVTWEGGLLKMPTQGLLPTPHQDDPWEEHSRQEMRIKDEMGRHNDTAFARRVLDRMEAARWRREAVRRSTTSALICDTFWRR